jgi:hypothetical protein
LLPFYKNDDLFRLPEQRLCFIKKFNGYYGSMVCGENHVLPVTFFQDAPNIKSKVKLAFY